MYYIFYNNGCCTGRQETKLSMNNDGKKVDLCGDCTGNSNWNKYIY